MVASIAPTQTCKAISSSKRVVVIRSTVNVMCAKFIQSKQYAEFATITCLDWNPLLRDDRMKEIIVQSVAYLSKTNRVSIYAFVIMSNHIHVLWQMLEDHERSSVQRDFLKYTGQRILKLPLHGGNMFIVDNTTSRHSFYAHNKANIPRHSSGLGAEGNIYQRFFWFEKK